MRSLQLLILMIGLTWVSSCAYKAGNPDDVIVGKYEVQSISITGCDDATQNTNLTGLAFRCESQGKFSICTSITVEFTNDRDYIFSNNRIQIDKTIGTALHQEEPEVGFYTISGNELSICFGRDCLPASFSIERKNLHLQIQHPDGCLESIMAIRK